MFYFLKILQFAQTVKLLCISLEMMVSAEEKLWDSRGHFRSKVKFFLAEMAFKDFLELCLPCANPVSHSFTQAIHVSTLYALKAGSQALYHVCFLEISCFFNSSTSLECCVVTVCTLHSKTI